MSATTPVVPAPPPSAGPADQAAAREHIEDIRAQYHRSVSGAGASSGGRLRPLPNLLESYMALLEALSSQPYTNSTRLFFEILQNCEDAPFTEPNGEGNAVGKTVGIAALLDTNSLTEHKVPTEIFAGGKPCGLLVVASNEDGFSPDNVASICTAAISSKSKQTLPSTFSMSDTSVRRRFIGEKGIGFKSVFAYSDVPHIISGEYKFRFLPKSNDNQLNMITPFWVEDEGIIQWARLFAKNCLSIDANDHSGTVFLFPLKESAVSIIPGALNEFTTNSDNILFLTSITRVIVANLGADATHVDLHRDVQPVQTTAQQLDQLVPEVSATTQPQIQLLELVEHRNISHVTITRTSTKMLAVPEQKTATFLKVDLFFRKPADVDEPKRKLAADVPVSMAFPLTRQIQADIIVNGRLFAYLPTKVNNLNLPCLVNADWILAMSREDFDSSTQNLWNSYILNEAIPEAYMVAFRHLVHFLKNDDQGFNFSEADLHLLFGAFPPQAALFNSCKWQKLVERIFHIPFLCRHVFLDDCPASSAPTRTPLPLSASLLAPASVIALFNDTNDVTLLGFPCLAEAAVYKAWMSFHDSSSSPESSSYNASSIHHANDRGPRVWNEKAWIRVLSDEPWLVRLDHTTDWFIKLYYALADQFPERSLPIALQKFKLLPLHLGKQQVGCQPQLVVRAHFIASPRDHALLEHGLINNEIKPILDSSLWAKLCEFKSSTFPKVLIREGDGSLGDWLSHVSLVSPFDQLGYLKSLFEVLSTKTDRAANLINKITPENLVILANSALKIILTQSGRSTLADALKRAPWFNWSLTEKIFVSTAYNDYPLRPLSVNPDIQILFAWEYQLRQNMLTHSVALKNISHRVLHDGYVDPTIKPWEDDTPTPKITKENLTQCLITNVLGNLYDGRPSPPLAIESNSDLLSVFPWLQPLWWHEQTLSLPEQLQLVAERYKLFLQWLNFFSKDEVVRKTLMKWQRSFSIVPYLDRDGQLTWHRAEELIMIIDREIPISRDLLLMFTPHVWHEVCTLSNILHESLGVCIFEQFKEQERAIKLLSWAEKYRAPDSQDWVKFHSDVVKYIVTRLLPATLDDSRGSEHHLNIQEQIRKILIRSELIRVHHPSDTSEEGVSSWHKVDLKRIVLLPASSATNSSLLGQLEGHHAWELLPQQTIIVWSQQQLGQYQYKLLLDGAKISCSFTTTHIYSLLKTCQDSTVSQALPIITDFVWRVYDLLVSMVPQAMATADEPLLVLHRSKWFKSSELSWDEPMSQLYERWQVHEGELQQLINCTYELAAGQQNFVDSVKQHKRPVEVFRQLCRPLMKKPENPGTLLVRLLNAILVSPGNDTIKEEAVNRLLQALLQTMDPQNTAIVAEALSGLGVPWIPINGKWWKLCDVFTVDDGDSKMPFARIVNNPDALQLLEEAYDKTIRPYNAKCHPIIQDICKRYIRHLGRGEVLSRLYKTLLDILDTTNGKHVESAQWHLFNVAMDFDQRELEHFQREICQHGHVVVSCQLTKLADVQWFDLDNVFHSSIEPMLSNDALGIFEKARSSTYHRDICRQYRLAFEESAEKHKCNRLFNLDGKKPIIQLVNVEVVLGQILQELKRMDPSVENNNTLFVTWAILDVAVRVSASSEPRQTQLKNTVNQSALFIHDKNWCSPEQANLKCFKQSFGSSLFGLKKKDNPKNGKCLIEILNTTYAQLSRSFNVHETLAEVTSEVDRVRESRKSDKEQLRSLKAMVDFFVGDTHSSLTALSNDVHIEALEKIATESVDVDFSESDLLSYLCALFVHFTRRSSNFSETHPTYEYLLSIKDRLYWATVTVPELPSAERLAKIVPLANIVLPDARFPLTLLPSNKIASEEGSQLEPTRETRAQFLAALPSKDANEHDQVLACMKELQVSSLEKHFKEELVRIEPAPEAKQLTSDDLKYIYHPSFAKLTADILHLDETPILELFGYLQKSQVIQAQKIERILDFGEFGINATPIAFRCQAPPGSELEGWLKRMIPKLPGLNASMFKTSLPVQLTSSALDDKTTLFVALKNNSIKNCIVDFICKIISAFPVRAEMTTGPPAQVEQIKNFTFSYLFPWINTYAPKFQCDGDAHTQVQELLSWRDQQILFEYQEVAAPQSAIAIADKLSIAVEQSLNKLNFTLLQQSQSTADNHVELVRMDFGRLDLAGSNQPDRSGGPDRSHYDHTQNLMVSSPQSSDSARQLITTAAQSANIATTMMTFQYSASTLVLNDNFDPLASIDLNPHPSLAGFLKSIGNWGEQLANEYLPKLFPASACYKIEWMNADGETGNPFDFQIVRTNDPGFVLYVEVKATLGHSTSFWWSRREYEFAREKGGSYMLLHVRDKDAPKVTCVDDPCGQGKEKISIDKFIAHIV